MPNVPAIEFREFAEAISELDVHPLVIANSVVQYVRDRIDPLASAVDGAFHVWQAGAVVLAAFYGQQAPEYTEAQVRSLTPDSTLQLIRAAGGLSDLPSQRAKDSDDFQRRAHLMLVRTLCTQACLQGDGVYELCRTLTTLGVSDGDGSPFDDLFQDAYGCSAREYAAMLFSFSVIACKRGTGAGAFICLDDLFKMSPARDRLLPIAEAILEDRSCPMEAVGERIARAFDDYSVDGFVQAFFMQKPFVRFSPGKYLCCPHPYLRLLAYNGPMFHGFELARRLREQQGHTKPWMNPHSEDAGRRFERLVGDTLAEAVPGGALHGDYEYLKKQNVRSSDFLVVPDDGRVVLIQAKLKRLSPDAFYGVSHEALVAETRGALAQSLSRSIRFLYRLAVAQDVALAPEYRELSRTVRDAPRVMLLGVVPAMTSLAHYPYFRGLVEEGIRADLRDEEWEWFESQSSRFVGWHIVDYEELARVVARRPTDLYDLLHEYLAYLQGKRFYDSGGFLQNLPDWLAEQQGDPAIPRLARPTELFDGFATWSTKWVFPNYRPPSD